MTTRTLLIRPVDASLTPLGATSSVADLEVSVSVDRDVALTDGTFIPADVPLIAATSVPVTGLKVPIIANDDATIAVGAGFALTVTMRFGPRRGMHQDAHTLTRRIVITSADPDTVHIATKRPPAQLPKWADAAGTPSGVAYYVDPVEGPIPYLVAPSDGTLTLIVTEGVTHG